MQNKNIQEPIHVNIQKPNSLQSQQQKQSLSMYGCQCPVCKTKLNFHRQDSLCKQKDQNCLHEFIKQFTSLFPLCINSTTVYNRDQGYHMHYSNGSKQENKSFIYKTKSSKLLSNFPISHNIHLFGDNFSKLMAKYETMGFVKKLEERQNTSHKRHHNHSQNPQERDSALGSILSVKYANCKLLYAQAYNQDIPVKMYYDRLTCLVKLDDILKEYIEQEVATFLIDKPYAINEQFWQWVFTQYGQDVFTYFATEFYCRAYRFFSKNTVHRGIFYWILQKPKSEFGDNTKVTQQLGKHKSFLEAQYFIAKTKKMAFKLKLANIKNIQIEYYQNLRSFQEQYQDVILQRIKTLPDQNSKPQKIKLGENTKSYDYQNRIDSFQSKVRDLFLKQQNKALNKVQTEKQFDGKEDSNKLARLLLPNMGEFKTIRQILNDQFAFQKLILFQQRTKQRQRLKKARQNLLGQHRGLSSGQKHIYEQSRLKNKLFTSRKIRMRTDY